MQNQIPRSEQAHIDAGDGARRTVTQARGGVRRGIISVLAASTVLAVIAVAAVWYFSAPSAATSTPPPAAIAQIPQQPLTSRAWDRRHLGANGLEKCRAFRLVLKHTTVAQASGGGSISPGQANRLQTELNAAKQMPPASVTPVECGVPL